MRISKNTLELLSDGGCEKAWAALYEYNLMRIFESNDMRLEITYDIRTDTYDVIHKWKYKNHRHTQMGMFAVSV